MWGGGPGYVQKHDGIGGCIVEWIHVLCAIGELDVSRGTGREWIFDFGVVSTEFDIGTVQCDVMFVSEFGNE